MLSDAETIIRPKLDADEQLIWTGRPKQGIRLQPADAFLLPFGLLWTVMAVGMVATIIVQPADPFSQTTGLIVAIFFVLIGLYILAGRFWVDAKLRRRTIYGVTDRRIIIVTGLFSQRVRSVNLRLLSEVTMTESKKGSGTITFGSVLPWYCNWGGLGWSGMETFGVPGGFQPIDNVGEVYRIIRQAQRAAT